MADLKRGRDSSSSDEAAPSSEQQQQQQQPSAAAAVTPNLSRRRVCPAGGTEAENIISHLYEDGVQRHMATLDLASASQNMRPTRLVAQDTAEEALALLDKHKVDLEQEYQALKTRKLSDPKRNRTPKSKPEARQEAKNLHHAIITSMQAMDKFKGVLDPPTKAPTANSTLTEEQWKELAAERGLQLLGTGQSNKRPNSQGGSAAESGGNSSVATGSTSLIKGATATSGLRHPGGPSLGACGYNMMPSPLPSATTVGGTPQPFNTPTSNNTNSSPSTPHLPARIAAAVAAAAAAAGGGGGGPGGLLMLTSSSPSTASGFSTPRASALPGGGNTTRSSPPSSTRFLQGTGSTGGAPGGGGVANLLMGLQSRESLLLGGGGAYDRFAEGALQAVSEGGYLYDNLVPGQHTSATSNTSYRSLPHQSQQFARQLQPNHQQHYQHQQHQYHLLHSQLHQQQPRSDYGMSTGGLSASAGLPPAVAAAAASGGGGGFMLHSYGIQPAASFLIPAAAAGGGGGMSPGGLIVNNNSSNAAAAAAAAGGGGGAGQQQQQQRSVLPPRGKGPMTFDMRAVMQRGWQQRELEAQNPEAGLVPWNRGQLQSLQAPPRYQEALAGALMRSGAEAGPLAQQFGDYVSLGGNDSSVGKQQDSAQPEVRMTPQQQLEAMLQQAAAAGAAQALSAYMGPGRGALSGARAPPPPYDQPPGHYLAGDVGASSLLLQHSGSHQQPLLLEGPGHLQLQRYQQQPPSASQHAAQLRQLQQERERRVGDDGRPIVRDYGAPAASGTGARPAPSAYDDVDQQSFCEGSTLSAGAHQRQLQQQVPYLPPDDDQADDALDVNMGAGIVVADEAEAAGEGDMAAAAQQAAAAAADGAEAGALGLQAEGSEAGSVGDGPGGREVQGQQHQLGGGGSSRGQLTEY